MELAEALRIVNTLAEGIDPISGVVLPPDHVCQQAQVVRALYSVVQRLRIPDMPAIPVGMRLENAGKPWTTAEEAELAHAFDAGEKITSLARKHGRTTQAFQGRLYRLGKVPAWNPGGNRELLDT